MERSINAGSIEVLNMSLWKCEDDHEVQWEHGSWHETETFSEIPSYFSPSTEKDSARSDYFQECLVQFCLASKTYQCFPRL